MLGKTATNYLLVARTTYAQNNDFTDDFYGDNFESAFQNFDVGKARLDRKAHAVLAAFSFIMLLPVGAFIVRWESPHCWIVHAVTQCIAYIIYIAAAVLGIKLVDTIRLRPDGASLVSFPFRHDSPSTPLSILPRSRLFRYESSYPPFRCQDSYPIEPLLTIPNSSTTRTPSSASSCSRCSPRSSCWGTCTTCASSAYSGAPGSCKSTSGLAAPPPSWASPTGTWAWSSPRRPATPTCCTTPGS